MLKREKSDNLKALFILNKEFKRMDENPYNYLKDGAHLRYVKYSGGDQIYKILSSDSLYAFNSELSNDWSENKITNSDKRDDVYITCFYCDYEKELPGDVYSQWTSYCQSGGASIEFYFGQNLVFDELKDEEKLDKVDKKFIESVYKLTDGTGVAPKSIFDYSIMPNDEDDSERYILYPLYPFPVSYYQDEYEEDVQDRNMNSFFSSLKASISKVNRITKDLKLDEEKLEIYNIDRISIMHFAPYIKHRGFRQEQEARLAFVNRDNKLSNCIRFLGDSKVPYICVKFGNRNDKLDPCGMLDNNKGKTLDEKAKDYFDSLNMLSKNSSVPIIIPQGNDQEEVYNAIEKQVVEYNKNKKGRDRISIICQGHLPITKITLAPTNDRELQKKKLEIFCKSKYWLRNVEICTSDLPYNMININHT